MKKYIHILLFVLITSLITTNAWQYKKIADKDVAIHTLQSEINNAAIILSEKIKEYEKRIAQLQEDFDNENAKTDERVDNANAAVDRLRDALQKETRKLREREDALRAAQNTLREWESIKCSCPSDMQENVSGGRTERNRGIYNETNTVIIECADRLVELAEYSDRLRNSGLMCEKSY